MFSNVSMAGVGAIITVLEFAVKLFGIELPDGVIAGAINGLVTFLGVLWLIWGQVRRPDLVAGITRKY